MTKVNKKVVAEEVNEREWCNFDIMATGIRETKDANLAIEFGEFLTNKRFYTFNLLSSQINKYKDMPYFLSLFERGDHRYQRYDIFEFMVYDNEKNDCTDEQLALIIEK